MTECNGNPAIGRVAGVALLAGNKVRYRLAGGLRAIMAGRTGPRSERMVEAGGDPCQSGVTTVTLSRGGYMRHWLASGGCSIMASGAATGNTIVVKYRG